MSMHTVRTLYPPGFGIEVDIAYIKNSSGDPAKVEFVNVRPVGPMNPAAQPALEKWAREWIENPNTVIQP